jgi:hypothetical protein
MTDVCEPLNVDLRRIDVNSPSMNRLVEVEGDGSLILNPIWATFGREDVVGNTTLVRVARRDSRESPANAKPKSVLVADRAVARVRKLVRDRLKISSWDNLILAGGAVSRTVVQENVKLSLYGEPLFHDHDFDLYLYGLGDDQEMIAERIRVIEREFGPDMVWRTDCVVSMVKFNSHTLVQIILLKAETPHDVIQTFDVDESRAYFDGSTVWVSNRWKEAFMTRCTTVRNELASPTLLERICKYANHLGHRIRLRGLDGEEKGRLVAVLGEFEGVVKQRIVQMTSAGKRWWPAFDPKEEIVVLASEEWKKALVIDVVRANSYAMDGDTLRFGVRVNIGTGCEALDRSSTHMYALGRSPGLTLSAMRSPIRCVHYLASTGHRTGLKVTNPSVQWRFLDTVWEKRNAKDIYAEVGIFAFGGPLMHEGPLAKLAKVVPAEVFAEYVIGNDFNERSRAKTVYTKSRDPVLYPFPKTIEYLVSVGETIRQIKADYEGSEIGYRVRSREEMFGAVGRSMEAFRVTHPS